MRRVFNLSTGGSFLLRDWEWCLIRAGVKAWKLSIDLSSVVDCQGDLCLDADEWGEVREFILEHRL